MILTKPWPVPLGKPGGMCYDTAVHGVHLSLEPGTMKPFDLENTPLDGVHLIEAGAGTGKTHTIAGLFLRLIVEQGLTIDQVLVVTYTKAATEELKRRIRERLLSARAILSGAAPLDPLTAALARRGVAPGRALQRIQEALTSFDRAAIFTIHGFCQRVLHHFAFETGHLFEAELVQDAQPLTQEVADDFWRRFISQAPAEFARYAVDRLKGPEAWTALFHHCRFPRLHLVPEAVKPALTSIAPWRRAAGQVCRAWPAAREAVLRLLTSESLSGTSYGRCAPARGGAGTTPRTLRLTALAAAMDQWEGGYPLFGQFEKFTQFFLNKSTKKNHLAPRHPFFDLCEHAAVCEDEMTRQFSDYVRYLKVKFVQEAGRRLDRKKNRKNILFFDDLLTQVHNALQSDRRAGLVDAIRTQYQAALVDEFQDTDPLQYEIFSSLFAGGRSLLFMIGDPKQAIYGFRGADIYAYLQARENARHQHTLTRNWRSRPDLIKAFNTLFGSHPRPFGFERIPFEAAVAAHPDLQSGGPPFRLWYVTRTDQEDVARPIAQQAALPRIVTAVAEEIVRLLSDAAAGLAPEAIAVLTRTHRQAQLVKDALARRRVPAVLHSDGRVFDTDEAADLACVLGALAGPSNPRKVRTALATAMLGADAAMLRGAMEGPADAWQARWARFDDYHQVWLRRGFYRMFSHFMAREGIKARLLTLPDGERRLTNLLHLAELLHRASVEHQLGPEGLIKWLTAQRRNGTMDADAQKLRLESDAHAVRIITTHKSKGLQFDVVFCPFTWTGVKTDDAAAVFHDPSAQERLTLAIGPDIAPAHLRQAAEEALAENLRLLYVALTRARHRCYMVWGCIKGTAISAPAYLLHSPPAGQGDWMAALQSKMTGMTDARMIAELNLLGERSQGTIAVQELPAPGRTRYANPYGRPVDLHCRSFERSIDGEWRVASFSSMTAALPPESDDRPDRDAEYVDDRGEPSGPPGAGGLLDFPRGAHAGLFFHDLLEHWDFGNADTDQRAALVAGKLLAHGFDLQWAAAVDRMLACLAHLRLPAGAPDATLQLARVPAHQRVNEMEFYFPLKRLGAGELKRVFEKHGQAIFMDFGTDVAVHPLDRLSFAPMHGFLKGYMDTVFLHEGRYYLVDWKSNHLGGTWEDYAPDRLGKVMAEAHYFLQYHLYVVALDQLLRRRVRGYAYERHFGGVHYLFLRGLRGAAASTGVYYTVPDPALLEALKELLVDTQATLNAYGYKQPL